MARHRDMCGCDLVTPRLSAAARAAGLAAWRRWRRNTVPRRGSAAWRPGSFDANRSRRHSITSSASCRIDSGIVRSSALAALRLITNLNLVGCSTGKSAGLAPLRIRST